MIRDDFTSGDRYPNADYFNAVAKASNLAMGIKPSVYNDPNSSNKALTGQVVIQVINKTEQFIPCFSVLEITDPKWRGREDVLSDVRNFGILYEGQIPSGDENKTAVITLSELQADEINKAVIMGIVPCNVNVLDIAHRFAVPIANDSTKLQSSDFGNMRLVLQPIETGEQVLDVMLGFGGGGGSAPVAEDYCTLITPVCNGFINDSIAWSAQHSTPKGFNTLRAGLGKLQSSGTGSPLQVFEVDNDTNLLVPKLDSGDPLFYKKLSIKLHTGGTTPEYDSLGGIEFNESTSTSTGWGGHALFYAYLQSLKSGEAAVSGVQYDYSDLWETTTDPIEAIPNNYVVVKPHQFMGYYPHKGQFKVGSSETIDLSISGRSKSGTAYYLDYELDTSVKLKGQWNGIIKYANVSNNTITWSSLKDVGSYINNLGKVMIVVPEYNGTNINIMDVNKIENTCGIDTINIPVPMGMYIDNNNMPQFVNCDSIPFQCLIPLLTVLCLYRMNAGNCSPAYQTNSYNVRLENNHIALQTANYLVGSPCSA